MDIDILLALQDFRNGFGGGLVDFFRKMTFFGEVSVVPIIMAIIYWAVSKKYGSYLMLGWAGSRLVNGALKVTACAYRPWIRDARVEPWESATESAKTTATGYSFPSGHTMNAATIFGSGTVRKDFPRFLRITLLILTFLVALSRNYLGVHTPQDVLVGMAAGLLVMWLTLRLLQWVDAHPGKDWLVACIGIVLAVGVALYAAFKIYPKDYQDGKLLVDGAKMANDTYKGVGWCAAILIGWVLERRFIRFTTDDIPMIRRIARVVLGLLGYYFLNLAIIPVIKEWIAGIPGTILTCFIQMFYISFIVPCCIRFFEKPAANKEQA
ncbi:MAG: phosphatase PAP2 family protein [Clostridia bacterium]|nr:phosphatase PAP2 family protein [Clostridia bacterium]